MRVSTGHPQDSLRAFIVFGLAVLAYFVAVAQRTSFGVAALDAAQRFEASAAVISGFTMIQVLVYGALQVPVGVLLDRFGSRALIAAGTILMAAGQLSLALAHSIGLGLLGRLLVGAGDAMTFICVLRLIPAWFSYRRAPLMTMLVGAIGNTGQFLSAVPFAVLLHQAGWVTAFSSMAALSVLAFVLVLAGVRDSPLPSRYRGALSWRRTRTQVVRCLREPVTLLGFWVHFTVQFIGTVFALMWGYPYLENAQGFTLGQASAAMTLFVLVVSLGGVALGAVVGRFPHRRLRLAWIVIAAGTAAWATLILWPGQAPDAVVHLGVAVIALSLPASMLAFSIIQSFTPLQRVGTATGIANVGGFAAALVAIFLIGITLDAVAGMGVGDSAYSPLGFRIAMATQFAVTAVGALSILRWGRRVRAMRGADSI